MELDEEALINRLRSPSPSSFYEEFSTQALSGSFPLLSSSGKDQVWSLVFNHIKEQSEGVVYCLKTLRCLTRDKGGIDQLLTEDRVKTLLTISYQVDPECAIEALKCLCNLILNYNKTAKYLEDLGAVEKSIKRLKDAEDEVQICDVKLLFLITALNRSARSKALETAGGIDLFTDILKQYKSSKLNEEDAKFCCDVMKLLFNLLLEAVDSETKTKCDINQTIKLATVLKDLLLVDSSCSKRVNNDVINLLTVIPKIHLLVLITPQGISRSEPDFNAVDKIITHLDILLTEVEEDPKVPKDTLSPVLLVLFRLAESHPCCRKYMRFKILPKLKDVSTRPEEGITIRNKLCRLLTCPVQCISDLVADFLFKLCKENVARMVKHTGFGNAAGLLARRGLMGASGEHNSDTEDSETEEYNRDKHLINPIIGCKEEPRENILDSMPYEQKEFLAMELVNNIDKLQRGGVIQPCRIVDGRPEPIESVQDLQLAMKQRENQG